LLRELKKASKDQTLEQSKNDNENRSIVLEVEKGPLNVYTYGSSFSPFIKLFK